jgi:hypothetical protein
MRVQSRGPAVSCYWYKQAAYGAAPSRRSRTSWRTAPWKGKCRWSNSTRTGRAKTGQTVDRGSSARESRKRPPPGMARPTSPVFLHPPPSIRGPYQNGARPPCPDQGQARVGAAIEASWVLSLRDREIRARAASSLTSSPTRPDSTRSPLPVLRAHAESAHQVAFQPSTGFLLAPGPSLRPQDCPVQPATGLGPFGRQLWQLSPAPGVVRPGATARLRLSAARLALCHTGWLSPGCAYGRAEPVLQ